MPVHTQKRRLPHSSEKIFDLVSDIERYPEFLPWCTQIRIVTRETDAQGREVLTADMAVRFKVFRERFKTRVVLDRAGKRIDVEYLDGPFSYLENRWDFSDNPDGSCTVDFHIDFEFRSRMLQLAISAVFGEAVRRMVAAFDARADALYGRSRI